MNYLRCPLPHSAVRERGVSLVTPPPPRSTTFLLLLLIIIISISSSISSSIYLCMYVYMYVCMYVYMYVYMYAYVCMYVWLHLCIVCISGLTIHTNINALAQGIKSFLASQVWFQAVVGAWTYGTIRPPSMYVCMYVLMYRPICMWKYIHAYIHRDYYPRVFGYRQYHVLGIKIVLCEPLASIIHYFFIPNTWYCRYPKTRG